MKKIFLSIVFIMFFGMTCTNKLYAQKPIGVMTSTELNALSDTQIKEGVIKSWSGILNFMMRGYKYDDRIVNAFAENFIEGALAWTKQEKYPLVDYVTAMDLVEFHNWYLATRENSCRETVMKLQKKIYPASFDNAWSRINDDLFGYVQMDQHGRLTATPPEYVNANTLINSMKP